MKSLSKTVNPAFPLPKEGTATEPKKLKNCGTAAKQLSMILVMTGMTVPSPSSLAAESIHENILSGISRVHAPSPMPIYIQTHAAAIHPAVWKMSNTILLSERSGLMLQLRRYKAISNTGKHHSAT